MSITPALRRLIEEREDAARRETARLLSAANEEARVSRIMAAIDDAAPLLDAVDRGPGKWRRSHLLKLGYCVIATSGSPGCEMRAADFVRDAIRDGA